ncbi:MAG: hypothetical protein R3330_18235, partial [Saprospiraceae bacterium]|nr:hypothetical protein [Saprospiraceae bacterium]
MWRLILGQNISRRGLFKVCLSALALVRSGRIWSRNVSSPSHYNRVRLVDTSGQPIRARNLEVGENYIFHYPYISTPCFLINLGQPAGSRELLQSADGKRYR